MYWRNHSLIRMMSAEITGSSGPTHSSELESADSTAELAHSTIDSVLVSRLPMLNMFTILKLPESADRNWPTIVIADRESAQLVWALEGTNTQGLVRAIGKVLLMILS